MESLLSELIFLNLEYVLLVVNTNLVHPITKGGVHGMYFKEKLF